MACGEVQLFRSYFSAFVNAGLCCLPLSALQCALGKNWCRVSDIATNKNCDSPRCYEQFARYNTLFYNPDANPIRKLYAISSNWNVFWLQHHWRNTDFYWSGERKCFSRSNFFLAVRLQLFHSDQMAWENRQVWIGSWQCRRSSREWICLQPLSCVVNGLSL